MIFFHSCIFHHFDSTILKLKLLNMLRSVCSALLLGAFASFISNARGFNFSITARRASSQTNLLQQHTVLQALRVELWQCGDFLCMIQGSLPAWNATLEHRSIYLFIYELFTYLFICYVKCKHDIKPYTVTYKILC